MKITRRWEEPASSRPEDEKPEEQGSLRQRARELLTTLGRDIPEAIRDELDCARKLRDAINILGKRGLMHYKQSDEITFIAVEPQEERPHELVILKFGGPLRTVVGQYVGPRMADGRRVTSLTDMDPKQTQQLVEYLYRYANSSATRVDPSSELEMVRHSREIQETGDMYPMQAENAGDPEPLMTEDVMEEAERILQEAYTDLQKRQKNYPNGYRQVPNLVNFLGDSPKITLYANFGQLI